MRVIKTIRVYKGYSVCLEAGCIMLPPKVYIYIYMYMRVIKAMKAIRVTCRVVILVLGLSGLSLLFQQLFLYIYLHVSNIDIVTLKSLS